MVGVELVTVIDSSSVSSCSGPLTVAVALALTTTLSMRERAEAGELEGHRVGARRQLAEAVACRARR